MILTINDISKIAYIQDFDQSEWDAQYSTIPWDYKIEVTPSVDDAILNGLNITPKWYRPTVSFTCSPNGQNPKK